MMTNNNNKKNKTRQRHSVTSCNLSSSCINVLQSLRAGATDDDVGNEDGTNDNQGDTIVAQEEGEDEEQEDDDAVEEEEDEDEEEEEEDDDDDVEDEASVVASSKDTDVSEYDDMLIPSPSMQMYSVIGVMLLSRKLDMFNPTVVRLGRYVYIWGFFFIAGFMFVIWA